MALKKWMYTLLVGIFAGVFLISSGFLIFYLVESGNQAEAYDRLAQIMEAAQEEPEDTTQQEELPQEDPVDPYVTVTNRQTGKTATLLREFAPLYQLNSDIVGWIRIPGTKVDYPVMQTPESTDYYLKRDFYQKKSNHGCIYVREKCDVFAPSDNLTIYGHYMRDGSMFAALGKYRKKAFWQEHKTITFNTLQARHEYEVFAVFVTTASVGEGFTYHIFDDAADRQAYEAFVDKCKKLALFDTGITPTYGDKLITLSTCEYSQTNGRLVVVARCID